MANINGWGRGSWGEGAWNAVLPVTFTGLSSTVSVGSVSVVAKANVTPTG